MRGAVGMKAVETPRRARKANAVFIFDSVDV
jgi:hypothetical protein